MKKFTLSLFLYCALLSAEEDIFRNNTNETDPTSSFEHGKENNNLIPAKSDSLESFKEQENKEKAKQLMDLKALQSVYFSKIENCKTIISMSYMWQATPTKSAYAMR
ncbi:hypothetical protein HpBT240_14100 [Helicobacter pylori]